MEQGALDPLERLIGVAWDRMVRILGVHTVLVVAQRAVWMTKLKHNEATLIDVKDTGFDLKRLSEQSPTKCVAVAEELLMSLMSVVTKLVGLEMSRRIAADIDGVAKS